MCGLDFDALPCTIEKFAVERAQIADIRPGAVPEPSVRIEGELRPRSGQVATLINR
jgi:hypothetical protein